MSAPTSDVPGSAVDLDLESGHAVGEYRVDGKLGQGAFGTVYRAVHPLIGKVVAIKVLARRFSVDPEMVSRFVAEARAVNQIGNRHIIDIFSFGALDDGRHYYVMEHLEGEPLDVTLDREGRLQLAVALPILRGLARALDAAHAKGIAHRDLKAENVFLVRDPDGGTAVWPKLLDFGIAKLLAPDDGLKHKTRTGAPIGTPYYMSPEQCRGKDVDQRTDFYAFGVLAYLMLVGRYPFEADDYMSILMQQINETPALPSSIAPELPGEIDDVILWLMAKDPAERPPDLRTAIRAFERAAERAGVVLPTSSWDVQTGPVGLDTMPPRRSALGAAAAATQAPEPARRRTGLIVALAAVAMAGAAVAGWIVLGSGESAPPRPIPVSTPPRPAPAPAAAPAPAPTPQLPRTVIVTVDGVPDGTEVLVGSSSIGVAPGPVQLARGDTAIVLTFKADGYVSLSKTVTPDRDQPLSLQLKKKPRSAAPGNRPKDKDAIIDVFGGKP